MVYILLGTGFEEIEAVAPCDLLRRAGIEVCFAALGDAEVTGSHGIVIRAEKLLREVRLEDMEMLVLPGGLRGVKSILASEAALSLTKEVWEAGKYVAAICAAPTILAQLGIVGERQATCYPGNEEKMGPAHMTGTAVTADGRLITGRSAGSAIDFGLELVSVLRGKEAAEKVAKAIVWQNAQF